MMQVGQMVHRDMRVNAGRMIASQNFAEAIMRRYARLWQRWVGLSLVFRRIRPIFLYDVAFESHSSPLAIQQWQLIQQMSRHLSRQTTLLNRTSGTETVQAVTRLQPQPAPRIINQAFMQRVHFHTGGAQVKIVPKEHIVYNDMQREIGSQLQIVYGDQVDKNHRRQTAYPANDSEGSISSLSPVPAALRMANSPNAQRQLMVVRHSPLTPAPVEAAAAPITDRAAFEQVAMKAATAPVDLNLLTEKVIRAIDQRVTAQRERMGRV